MMRHLLTLLVIPVLILGPVGCSGSGQGTSQAEKQSVPGPPDDLHKKMVERRNMMKKQRR
jgi:hypothetical protein